MLIQPSRIRGGVTLPATFPARVDASPRSRWPADSLIRWFA